MLALLYDASLSFEDLDISDLQKYTTVTTLLMLLIYLGLCIMPMTHLPETRAGIKRQRAALDSSASFRRELQQNLR